MVLFIYLAGLVVSFILCAFFDAKGLKLLGLKPRSEIYDAEFRTMLGGIGMMMWPVSLTVIVFYAVYSGLVYVFGRESKTPKIWSCPMIKPASGYRDTIERCAVKAKSVKRLKCGKHHCNMEEGL